mgnify:FL=1
MMKFPIINRLFPSYKWKVAAVIIGGVIVGGGALFMYMLRAHTYLGDDPAACVNCHIMILTMQPGSIVHMPGMPLA